MADRYISTSERSKQLLLGAGLYARRGHEVVGSQAYEILHDAWLSWTAQWGEDMMVAAIELQEQAFQKAQRF